MRDPVETAELLAFIRIVDAKSLSRAAAELALPRATLTRRLARLEERLGVRLLRRTTRSLAVTEAGEAFYRQARVALEAVKHAEASVQPQTGEAIRGDLRVSAPPVTDETLYAMIVAFAAKYPNVRVQVEFTSRVVDLRREGYDVALRATDRLEPGLIARTLRRAERIGVASPAYLREHGTPTSAKQLRGHRCLTGFARGELPQVTWRVGNREVHVESALSSNDPQMLVEAALAGLGIALVPQILVDEHVAAGTLVRVLPNVLRDASILAVVYAERELQPPHVRAFIEAMLEWSKTAPMVTGARKART